MNEKAVILMSGGIDSPMAAHLTIQSGLEPIILNLVKSEDEKVRRKVRKIRKELEDLNDTEIEMVELNIEKVYKELGKVNSKYTCVICKRMMYRIAEKIAKKESAEVIVTGENLGQVASQTLENLKVLDEAVDLPVLRPLIGENKQETIDASKNLGLYSISTSYSKECPHLPKKPATTSTVKEIKEEENEVEIEKILEGMLE